MFSVKNIGVSGNLDAMKKLMPVVITPVLNTGLF